MAIVFNKKDFDMEYSTQLKAEYEYLKEQGILPVFVRHVGEHGVAKYKYIKTSELFIEVAKFYHAREVEATKKFLQQID